MKIREKLLAVPAIVLLLMLLLGAVGILSMRAMRNSLQDIYDVQFQNFKTSSAALDELSEADTSVYRLFTWLNNYNEAKIKTVAKSINQHIENAVNLINQLKSNQGMNDDAGRQISQILESLSLYQKQVSQAIDYVQVDPNMGLTGMQTAENTFFVLRSQAQALVDIADKKSKQQYDASIFEFKKTLTEFVVILLAAIIIGTTASLLLGKKLLSSIHQAIASTHRIAAGDLTGAIIGGQNDETGELLSALAEMQNHLREMIGGISTTANQLSKMAENLNESSKTIANGTSEQHNAAASMASAIEEMSVSISVINNHAQDADRSVRESSQISANGKNVLSQVEGAMQRIEQSVHDTAQVIQTLGNESERISDIINVIKSIADQTNLLALNAAIEAARAGEQGRGFAVVADEVRSLAARTASSTQEIAEMIKAIQHGVAGAVSGMASGVNLVSEGGELASGAESTIEQIVLKIDEVAIMVGEISAALHEQRSASELIANQVQHIATMAEQNNMASNETAHSAVHLNELSMNMRDLVNHFKV